MTKNPGASKPKAPPTAGTETEQQLFDRTLAHNNFKPLKAVLESLRVEGAVLRETMLITSSYPDFLSKLGYRLVLVEHIHEQHSYTLLGPQGGIRAVLPHHDTTSYNTLVTLVNYDSSVTTTPNAVKFYSASLAELKKLLTK